MTSRASGSFLPRRREIDRLQRQGDLDHLFAIGGHFFRRFFFLAFFLWFASATCS
jgi:hypothetical protein